MPTTSGNADVQKLMHDAGTTVGMSYGCAASGGSSADDSKVPGILKTKFGFASANYSSSYSMSSVQSDIDNNWPVILGGL